MFGLGSNSYSGVEDVIVQNADDVVIRDPEDVFIEEGAVRGEIEIVDVGDVYFDGRGETYGTPSRDCILDGGKDAKVKGCEDVLVRARSVEGNLRIEGGYDDVFTKQDNRVVTEDVEDVQFRDGVTTSADVKVESAQDVWFHQDAVQTNVTAEDTEDVLQQSPDAVTGEVTETRPDRRAPVHLDEVEDVYVHPRGIDGQLLVADPADVLDDADF